MFVTSWANGVYNAPYRANSLHAFSPKVPAALMCVAKGNIIKAGTKKFTVMFYGHLPAILMAINAKKERML